MVHNHFKHAAGCTLLKMAVHHVVYNHEVWGRVWSLTRTNMYFLYIPITDTPGFDFAEGEGDGDGGRGNRIRDLSSNMGNLYHLIYKSDVTRTDMMIQCLCGN